MNYHILTLFPEMVLDGLNTSIIGRAAGKGLLSIEAVNIRDYTKEKHGHVDDTPYGGGAGMVMQAAPVCDAYEALCERIGKRPRVLYMTPQGQTFNQKIAEELAQEEDLVFLCGHYEGIDERALELIVTDYLSVGDYVLTGGELPAMVMIDCISRLVPGVLNQHTHRGVTQIERQLCRQIPIRQSSNAVGSEHTWHESQILAICKRYFRDLSYSTVPPKPAGDDAIA